MGCSPEVDCDDDVVVEVLVLVVSAAALRVHTYKHINEVHRILMFYRMSSIPASLVQQWMEKWQTEQYKMQEEEDKRNTETLDLDSGILYI